MKDKILDSINYLFGNGEVVEIRILKYRNKGKQFVSKNVMSGYFNDYDSLAQTLEDFYKHYDTEAVYFTLNPVDRDLLARSANCLSTGINTTSDHDIPSRKWILVDIDPIRKPGISSTDAEHGLAFTKARNIATTLEHSGFPSPVFADSGNGYHLLYRVDLPTEDEHLVEQFLNALAMRFNDAKVEIDTSVFNPSRITAMYGTMKCKGSDTVDRPHRQAGIRWDLSPEAEDIEVVNTDLIKEIAATYVEVETKPTTDRAALSTDGRFNLESWLDKHSDVLKITKKPTYKRKANGEGFVVWNVHCPFNDSHGKDAFVYKFDSGPIGFKCWHNGCTDHNWHSFREKLEPGYKNKYRKQADNKPKVDPAAEGRHFFYDSAAKACVFADTVSREFTTYSNMKHWENKYTLLYHDDLPTPYPEYYSVYDPTKDFGPYTSEGRKYFNRFVPSEYWFYEFPDDFTPQPTPVFDALYANLFGSDTTVKTLLAAVLQQHRRFRIIPVIINEKGGAGKGIFENHVLAPILGDSNCSLNLGHEDLSSNYNDYLVDKLYVGFHETSESNDRTFGKRTEQKLKRLYDDTITVEKKFVARQKQPNYATTMIYSNSSTPVSISLTDRRVWVKRTRDTQLQDIPPFKQTAEDTAQGIDTYQQALQTLATELPSVVYSLKKRHVQPGFGNVPPMTPEKLELQERSLSPIQEFIRALFEQDIDTLAVMADSRGNELNRAVVTQCFKNGRITTKEMRAIIGSIFKDRIGYESIKTELPTQAPKAYNGFKYWEVTK